MKPNFALSLSFDGLRLMHRVADGWHLVGQVALDDPDLTGKLENLRAAAETLEPGGISTKLLIPNDQIKYLALDTTRSEDAEVRLALNGATPYDVDDLVYDFAKGGGRTYVAAVAKETLSEAQQFAGEYGFNPVSFAAIPEPFTYVGEAFFGSIDGHNAERDTDSVIVTGQSDVTISDVATTADLVVEDVSDADVAEDTSAPNDDTPTLEDAAQHDEAEKLHETAASGPEPVQPAGDDKDAVVVEPVSEDDSADIELDVDNTPKAAPDAEHNAPSDDPGAVPNTALQDAVDSGAPDAEPAPMFASRLRADRSEGQPAPPPDARPDAPRERTEPTFSRTPSSTLAVPTGSGTDPMPSLSAPSRNAGSPAMVAATAAPLTTTAPDADLAPAITGDAPTALSADAAVAAPSLNVAPDPHDTATNDTKDEKRSAAATALGAAAGAATAVGGMFASRRMARAETKAKAAQTETQTHASTDPASTDEKSRLTVFGARKKPAPKPKIVIGGKPRFLGLILTAVLLLFLLAIAAFAALSEEGIASWFGFGASETQIAATPADPTSASEVAAPQGDDAAVVAASDTADAMAPPTAPEGGSVLTPEEATRIYAATGVWQRAPRLPLNPRITTLNTLALAVKPRPVVRVPASPLISANSVTGDAVIATPIDPPSPSQTFDFNAQGQVVATPEGAITPDGILVISGRPPLNPPTRPGTVAPDITPQDQLATVIPDAATEIVDAPDGVIIIAGRPTIEPPVRAGTAAPAPAPPAPAPLTQALTSGVAPLVSNDGLLVLAGSPPILPPARTGTVAPALDASVAIAPTPSVDIANQPSTPDTTSDLPVQEGLNMIAGPPPILPPSRPGTVAPRATVDALTQDIAAALTTSTAQTPDANTPRPAQRPATIADAAIAAAEAAAAANTPILGALTVAQAANFRPRTRPAGLAPVVPDPAPEDAALQPPASASAQPAGLQISPEIAAAVQAAANRPNPIVNETALAVLRSSRPDTRPRNMERIVARANQAAARAAATQVAAVAPRTVAPSGPTGGSVAQAATLDNAINLRQVNLIGIYGGSGDRRALVRMSNGRYMRVTVGDRLDGGRVTAISAEALSYSKSGRPITLRVPG